MRVLFAGATAVSPVLINDLISLGNPQVVEAAETPPSKSPPDFDFIRPGVTGHFYTQTRGQALDTKGFSVINDGQANFYDAFKQYGAVAVWGYPVSQRWIDPQNRVTQAFQKGIFQLSVDKSAKPVKFEWLNILDEIGKRGINLDNPTDLVPSSFNWSSDAGKVWGHTRNGGLKGSVEENHINAVFGVNPQYPALKEKYLANPLWFDQYGLPMSIKDYGAVVVVRCQRTILQLWKGETPWTTKPMEVVVGNGGDLAKKYGLIPAEVSSPVDSPVRTLQIPMEKPKYTAPVIFRKGDPDVSVVFPTFDDFFDGQKVLKLLDELEKTGVRITLFPTGGAIQKNPDAIKRAYLAGHDIELHTFSHPYLTKRTDSQIRQEINGDIEILRQVIGDPNYSPSFLRPPFGDYDDRVAKIAAEAGLKLVLWDHDSRGFELSDTNKALENSIKGLVNGSIIVEHPNNTDISNVQELMKEIAARDFSVGRLIDYIR